MTAKEIAKELIEKFVNQAINFPYIDSVDKQCIGAGYMTFQSAKQCALICIEEIIESTTHLGYYAGNRFVVYWLEVKEEINKL